jgi:hypothetical protein
MCHPENRVANINCPHIPSGLYCCCVKNNAECLLCEGWFTPKPERRATWKDYTLSLEKRMNNN